MYQIFRHWSTVSSPLAELLPEAAPVFIMAVIVLGPVVVVVSGVILAVVVPGESKGNFVEGEAVDGSLDGSGTAVVTLWKSSVLLVTLFSAPG